VLMIRRVRHRCRCRCADQHICGAGRTRIRHLRRTGPRGALSPDDPAPVL